MKNKSTTIKLNKETKKRLDNLKMYKRETYDDIVQRALEILNICVVNPLGARSRLLQIKKQTSLSKIKKNADNYN